MQQQQLDQHAQKQPRQQHDVLQHPLPLKPGSPRQQKQPPLPTRAPAAAAPPPPPSPSPPPASAADSELLRQAQRMQQQAAAPVSSNFCKPQATAHAVEVVRLDLTRRAPVTFLPVLHQHAAPSLPSFRLPYIATSAAAIPHTLTTSNSPPPSQTSAPAAQQRKLLVLEVEEDAEEALARAQQRHGAAQVWLCARLHVIQLGRGDHQWSIVVIVILRAVAIVVTRGRRLYPHHVL